MKPGLSQSRKEGKEQVGMRSNKQDWGAGGEKERREEEGWRDKRLLFIVLASLHGSKNKTKKDGLAELMHMYYIHRSYLAWTLLMEC